MYRYVWLLLLCACDDSGSTPECSDTVPCVGEQVCVENLCVEDPVDGGRRDVPQGEDAGQDVADAGPVGPIGVDPPEPPVFSEDVGTVSIALVTATDPTSETDDPLEVCLSEDRCWRLQTPAIDEFESGQTDVFHEDAAGLTRSDIDRVVLRSRSDPLSDNDRYTPACLEIRLDGEPVYCNDALGVHIGTGESDNEVPSYSDPMGLHNACVTCQGSTLTHGPVIGAPQSQQVSVWVRTDATRRVALHVSETVDGADSVATDWAYPSPLSDFTTTLRAPLLQAGKEYYYRVEVEGAPPEPYRPISTTPLPSSTEPVKLAFGSCGYVFPQPVFDPILETEPDLFLWVGDIHYANSAEIDAQRWFYRRNRDQPGRAEMMSRVPTLATWDDHDFVGNNSDGGCVGKEDALAVFQEWWTNPAYGIEGTPGTFFRHRHGPVELFVTDCRYHRPRVVDASRRCEAGPAPEDRSGGPLGRPQFDWLVDAVSESDAPFKLLACGSGWTNDYNLDSWFSFTEARDELFAELSSRNVDGVVLLSGDVHRSEIWQYPRVGDYPLTELVSSPLARWPIGSSRAACPRIDGRIFCHPYDSFIQMEARLEDDGWVLQANVQDETGELLHTETLLRSELE